MLPMYLEHVLVYVGGLWSCIILWRSKNGLGQLGVTVASSSRRSC